MGSTVPGEVEVSLGVGERHVGGDDGWQGGVR